MLNHAREKLLNTLSKIVNFILVKTVELTLDQFRYLLVLLIAFIHSLLRLEKPSQ